MIKYNALNGVNASIGIKSSYNAVDGSLTITEILAGSPAESILSINDRILRIDGNSLKNRNVNDIDAMLQGASATNVTLTIVRDIKVFDITIVRQEFKEKKLKIAELFLPEKHILLRTLKRSDTPQNYVSSNVAPFQFGIVVLVNEKTASSCEIIAGTLHDNKIAKLVGTKTRQGCV